MSDKIEIVSKIELNGYIKLIYILTYRKPILILVTLIGAVMLTLSILYFLGLYDVPDGPPYYQLVMGILLTVIIPYSVYRGAVKNFNTNERLKETIRYGFDQERIKIKGESFSSELTWPKTHKVIELKDWILIYQNRIVANIIPKGSFTQTQLSDFKRMVSSVPNVKTKFRG